MKPLKYKELGLNDLRCLPDGFYFDSLLMYFNRSIGCCEYAGYLSIYLIIIKIESFGFEVNPSLFDLILISGEIFRMSF